MGSFPSWRNVCIRFNIKINQCSLILRSCLYFLFNDFLLVHQVIEHLFYDLAIQFEHLVYVSLGEAAQSNILAKNSLFYQDEVGEGQIQTTAQLFLVFVKEKGSCLCLFVCWILPHPSCFALGKCKGTLSPRKSVSFFLSRSSFFFLPSSSSSI